MREELVTARLEVARLEQRVLRAQLRLRNAVRRLHEAGSAVPDIARAVGLGEETVERVVRPSTYEPALACSFCAATDSLVAGPGVYICSRCVELAHDVGAGQASERPVAMRLQTDEDTEPCNFCGKRHTQVEFVIEGLGARVCNECLDLCDEILAETFQV